MSKLPDKLNFKIGEAGKIAGAPLHALRYWEKEFPLLKPSKFINNQRIYSKKDIEILLLIKALLYGEKFSIDGLRKHLPFYLRQLKKHKKERENSEKISTEKKVHQLLSSIARLRAEINTGQKAAGRGQSL